MVRRFWRLFAGCELFHLRIGLGRGALVRARAGGEALDARLMDYQSCFRFVRFDDPQQRRQEKRNDGVERNVA